MEFVEHKCLCEKSFDEIDDYFILSINKIKRTLQIIRNNNGSFGPLLGEFHIDYCPMCGRKLGDENR